MNSLVKHLCEYYDADTRSLRVNRNPGNLLLVGSKHSVFLNQVYRKAQSFGIPSNHPGHKLTTARRVSSIVVDRETAKVEFPVPPDLLPSDLDVDNLISDGMSSCAKAVFLILESSRYLTGQLIVIVGKGHAVKGLAAVLGELTGALVFEADSKTEDLDLFIQAADIVVYATPTLTQPIRHIHTRLVIDLGGVVPRETLPTNCEYIRHVGPLTISILLNRVIKR